MMCETLHAVLQRPQSLISFRYGNNYANLGSVGHHRPGKYRIRYANEVGHEPGIQLCDDMVRDQRHSGCGTYQGYVNSPTPYGTFVGRLLVRDNGTDLQRVHQIQNQTALYAVGTRPRMSGPRTPPLSIDLLNRTLSNDVPTRIMEMTARIAPYNPPAKPVRFVPCQPYASRSGYQA